MCGSKDPVFMQILLTQREKGKDLQAVRIGVAALLKAEGLRSTGDLFQGQQLSAWAPV